MNNKGFTLVEVITTLAILSLLTLILVPTVNSMIQKQNENSLKELEESIKTSSLNYAKENKWDLDIDCSENKNTVTITLEELLNKNYLTGTIENGEEVIKNPQTKENIDLSKEVTITYNCDNITFSADFTLQ